ncbi:nucleoside/nucleotide kinase family protein [Acaryochloris marina]|nr:hypothetical protein [Acaryochloris marina]
MEGIFVLTLPEILEYLDFNAYVEVQDDLRMNRRILGRSSQSSINNK